MNVTPASISSTGSEHRDSIQRRSTFNSQYSLSARGFVSPGDSGSRRSSKLNTPPDANGPPYDANQTSNIDDADLTAASLKLQKPEDRLEDRKHEPIAEQDSASPHEHFIVYCTGHSMGGALATLAAYDLSVQFQSATIQNYSFGCPRVGTSGILVSACDVHRGWFISQP
jgi:hypothetical protein